MKQGAPFRRYEEPAPQKTLSLVDAIALIVGIVIGAGIFKTPAVVAAQSGTESLVLLVWLAGGAVSLIGALCYAELASTYPHVGGDYHYIRRGFGGGPAFLFAWARMTVIQTGSIAMLSFIVGDYASGIFRLGDYSASLYAALVITVLTVINAAGLRQGKRAQNLLTAAIVLGLVSVIVTGLVLHPQPARPGPAPLNGTPSFGKAMIFVLLTYGGWNEAAYISAEVRETKRTMARALLLGIGIVTAIYTAVNLSFVRGLGLSATAGSEAVAADLMRSVWGEGGAGFISALIIAASLSTINATMITGARSNYALGRDFPLFGFLGRWHERANTPVNALLVQGGIALSLVALGTGQRSGFSAMVEYTAPVFWLFFLIIGLSLFVLRRKDSGITRPFRVPLYPLTPLLFCLFCVYMLRSSLAYTGIGALAGVAVLLAGMPMVLAVRRYEKTLEKEDIT